MAKLGPPAHSLAQHPVNYCCWHHLQMSSELWEKHVLCRLLSFLVTWSLETSALSFSDGIVVLLECYGNQCPTIVKGSGFVAMQQTQVAVCVYCYYSDDSIMGLYCCCCQLKAAEVQQSGCFTAWS